MRCPLKTIIAVFLLLLGICRVAAQPPASVPDFTMYKLDGSSFTNHQVLAGKLSLFVFFDPSCDHCQHAIQQLDQYSSGLKKVVLYLVSVEIKEKIKPFLATYGPKLLELRQTIILQDRQNQFAVTFKPKKYPAMFLYSPKKVLLQYEDDENKVLDLLSVIKKHIGK